MPEGGVLRVLLVEDDPDDQGLVRQAFQEPAPLVGPVELEVVGDADAALAAVRRASFAVILTDHILPGRTGLELLRALREADDRTPVVMITGAGDEDLVIAALQQGAADYVVKELGFARALPVVVDRVVESRARELERARTHDDLARYARRLEREVADHARALRQAVQESEALRRVGHALATARDLKPALDLVTQTTAQLLRAPASVVMIRASAEFVLASVWGALKQAPGLKSADLPRLLAAGWEEIAAAPLRAGEEEVGMLWAGRSRPQAFSQRELEHLASLADLASLTIVSVRAHQRPVPRRARAEIEQLVAGEAPRAVPSTTPGGRAASPPASGPVETTGLVVPPFPAALGRLLALAEDDDAGLAEVEEAVGLDPVLATRAMQLASAPALGRAHPAASVREALMVLGVRGVRNLAFAQFSRRLVLRWGAIDELLWEQSLATAAGTHVIVEAREPGVADDAYLCGLLHNVGAVALNNAYPDRYERAVQRSIAEDRPLSAMEREEFGHDAAGVTVELVSLWSLPPRVARTLAQWRRGAVDARAIGVALRWACVAALRTSAVWQRLLGKRREPGWIARELEAAEGQLGLSPAALAEVRGSIAARCEVLRRLVG